MNTTGIYQIKNTTNGNVYIGSSKDIIARLKKHRSHLIQNKHVNAHLQNAWNKYGEENFVFETIDVIWDSKRKLKTGILKNQLLQWEQLWMDHHKNHSYNILPTAGSSLGCKQSEEFRRKISEMSKGRRHSETTKKLISEKLKNNSNALGYKQSEDTKLKVSKNSQGQNNPMYGKVAWNKGIKLSEEHCKRMSEIQKISQSRPEIRRKNIESHKDQIPWNKGLSEETNSSVAKYVLHFIGSNNPIYKKYIRLVIETWT